MKNIKFSKKLIVCIFIFLLLFVIAMCFLFYKTGSEPVTLISCVFAFCGLEGGILGWIKINESNEGNASNNQDTVENLEDELND